MNKTKKSWINLIFALIILIVILVLIPLFLKCPFVKYIISGYLGALGVPEYKTAFVEVLFSFLGSFLAIYGALWTQRQIDTKKDKDDVKKNALIVYYDLKLGFQDLSRIHTEIWNKSNLDNKRQLYFSRNWIENVAVIPLSDESIQKLYETYGDLHTFKQLLSDGISGKNNPEYNRLIKIYFNKSFLDNINSISSANLCIDTYLGQEYVNLLNALKGLA